MKIFLLLEPDWFLCFSSLSIPFLKNYLHNQGTWLDDDLFNAMGDFDWFLGISFSFHSISELEEDKDLCNAVGGWNLLDFMNWGLLDSTIVELLDYCGVERDIADDIFDKKYKFSFFLPSASCSVYPAKCEILCLSSNIWALSSLATVMRLLASSLLKTANDIGQCSFELFSGWRLVSAYAWCWFGDFGGTWLVDLVALFTFNCSFLFVLYMHFELIEEASKSCYLTVCAKKWVDYFRYFFYRNLILYLLPINWLVEHTY